MYAEVDVFISNYTLVDADIFQLWTEGYSCKQNTTFTSDLKAMVWLNVLKKICFGNLNSNRSSAFPEYKRCGQKYGCTFGINSIGCFGPLPHIFIARTSIVHTNQTVGTAIISTRATKSTASHRKVSCTFPFLNCIYFCL